jgi:hypothetical protein
MTHDKVFNWRMARRERSMVAKAQQGKHRQVCVIARHMDKMLCLPHLDSGGVQSDLDRYRKGTITIL